MRAALRILMAILLIGLLATAVLARDLKEIQQDGVIRHLGVPYANFVTGQGDGLSVELIQLFARYLGVRYEYVRTDWKNAITDLVGREISVQGGSVEFGSEKPVRGDLIANGLTLLPWRQQVVNYSSPTFPTQVWLVTTAASSVQPIVPVNETEDIAATRLLLAGCKILGKQNTCLDPAVYPFADDNFETRYFSGSLNEMFPALMNGEAEMTLLDVPDALVAISRWPGEVKVIGPLSAKQAMGVGFRKDTPELEKAFNAFYAELEASGVYKGLVQKYYPDVFDYYPEFF